MYTINHFTKHHVCITRLDGQIAFIPFIIFGVNNFVNFVHNEQGSGGIVSIDITRDIYTYGGVPPPINGIGVCSICDRLHTTFVYWDSDDRRQMTTMCMQCFNYIKECYNDYDYFFDNARRYYTYKKYSITERRVQQHISAYFAQWEFTKIRLSLITHLDLNNDVIEYIVRFYKQLIRRTRIII